MNPLLMIDGYKADHRRQYPSGTTLVYSNLTPRNSRVHGSNAIVFFGLQYFAMEYLIDRFNRHFFGAAKAEVIAEYKSVMDRYLGKDAVPVDHISDLWDLGYLPVEVKALDEGTICPVGVPVLTIKNTISEFFWLTNQLETILSATIWLPCTSATTAYRYRNTFNEYATRTGVDSSFCKFQGHDFGFRGMTSLESAMLSGAAHLTSFAGTDTVPALKFIEKYYGDDTQVVGCSVPATEHSVMCIGTKDAEIETYRRLIRDVYPSGIVSIVSDTWDFWSIMTAGMQALKDDILRRDGKVVIRPDSGDPVKIICGDPNASIGSPENKGAVQVLWDTFGGDVTETGYKRLCPKIGLIYGDSITIDRQNEILSRLESSGFCSDIVLGIGSFTYQYVTRDTYGFAMKATYGIVDGSSREIFKSPKTDGDSLKKSARGLLRVNEDMTLSQSCTEEEESGGLLTPVFRDGVLLKRTSIGKIRTKLHGENF